MMDVNESPIVNKFVKKPSWVFPLLLFTLVVILSLQITQHGSGFSARPVSYPGIPSPGSGTCDGSVPVRAVKMSIVEFGGVGDGVTSNTAAFAAAMRWMKGFVGRGGAQLNVPRGKWVTGSFNLSSDFTLFLEDGAVIMGSETRDSWFVWYRF
ncbi:putative pectate lyase [Helianthus anomalus]